MVLQSYTDPFFFDDLQTVHCKDDLIELVDALTSEFFEITGTPDTGNARAEIADVLQEHLLNMDPGEIVSVGGIYVRAITDERYNREFADYIDE